MATKTNETTRRSVSQAGATVWSAAVEAFRPVYQAEVERLCDVYAPRIRAGEFSGNEGEQLCDREARYTHLWQDLTDRSHPWTRTWEAELLVRAVSPRTDEVATTDQCTLERMADVLMALDIMGAAAARGWVEPWSIDADSSRTGPFARCTAGGQVGAAVEVRS